MAIVLGNERKLQNRTVLGIILMIIGLSLYSLSDAFVKHLMETYSVRQTTFLRAFSRFVPLMIATFFQGGIAKVLSTNHPKQHFFRLLVNLLYTYCFMYAFSMGSLTVVYTLSYTSSFFMILLSAWMLKETISRERWIAVSIGLIGVIVALHPGSNVFEFAALLVLLGTFLGALNKILMRQLAATEHSLAITIYPNLMMMIVTVPFLFKNWQPMPWEHWGLFAVVGVITATGQYLIVQALRFAQGSALAPIEYSTFFWVVALDYFWWQNNIDLSTALGASIIVCSNLYILYCTRKETRKKTATISSS